MSRLPKPISRLLESTTDEERMHRSWTRLAARRDRPASRVGVAIAAAAAILVGLGGVASYQAWTRPGPIALAGGEALPAALPLAVDLDDGSSIASTAPLRSIENSGSQVSLQFRSGRARFSIEPHGPRRWEVRTPLATVRVVGTIFVVEGDESFLEVRVERGIVEVRSALLPGGVTRLSAGQSVRVDRPEAIATAAPHRIGETIAASGRLPSEEADVHSLTPTLSRFAGEGGDSTRGSPPPRNGEGARDDGAGEREHAASALPRASEHDANDTNDATERAANDGEAGAATDEVGDLLAEADRARRQGRALDAVAPLRAVMERRDDPRAALAAYTLATLELDVLRDPSRAADDYRIALDLGLTPRLEQEARARRAQALGRAGRAAEAREAAQEYLRTYSMGAHAAEMRRWAADP